jgi:cell division protein FtsB
MVLNMRIQCRFFALWLAVFLLISWSCVSLSAADDKAATAESIRRDVEKEALQDALNAFNARDYEKAKIGFEILSESSQNPEIARQALFGLASAKLVLANTSAEYEDAISSWKKWSGEVNSWQGCEDPRMITPFLLRLQSSIKTPAESLSGTKGRRSAREVDSKVILQTKEREMQTLRAKLDLREREIRRLRHQLESIEEIHRKYQEKKQESNP